VNGPALWGQISILNGAVSELRLERVGGQLLTRDSRSDPIASAPRPAELQNRDLTPRLLSGEKMTVRKPSFSSSSSRPASDRFIPPVFYAMARAFKNVAVLIRLFAMTPRPTQRAVPSAPW
jgi:hypothetical protein